MVPYTREGFKIGALVFGLAGGTPESDGLAGERLCADQVAGGTCGCYVGAEVVPGADCHAETEDLDFACVDGSQGAGSAE